jgi:hypothetical protein
LVLKTNLEEETFFGKQSFFRLHFRFPLFDFLPKMDLRFLKNNCISVLISFSVSHSRKSMKISTKIMLHIFSFPSSFLCLYFLFFFIFFIDKKWYFSFFESQRK